MMHAFRAPHSPRSTRLARAALTLLLAAAARFSLAGEPLDERTLATIIQHEDLRDSAPMLELLAGSGSEAIRARAALAVGRVGLPADAPALVAALRDESADVRAAAVFALGEMLDAGTLAEIGLQGADEASIEALVGALQSDPSAEVARRAIEALGKCGSARAVIPVAGRAMAVAEMDRPEADEELEFELAAMALVRLAAADASEVLHLGARSVSPRIRAASLHAMGRLRDAKGLEIFAAQLADADPIVRGYAVRGLGAVGGATEVAKIGGLANDPDWGVRIEALRALALIGGPTALEALRERYQTLAMECLDGGGSAWVAANGARANELAVAIDALGEADPSSFALESLDKLRAQGDAVGLRALVAHAKIAERSGVPDAFMRFPEGFSAHAPETARALAQALGEARTSESLQLVGKMLSARGAPLEVAARLKLVRPDLLESMSRYEIGNSKEFLLGLLDDPDLHVRSRAVSLLAPEDGPPPDDAMVEALATAYKADVDVAPDGRLAILDALSRRVDSAVVTDVLRLGLQDVDRLVRARAVKILGLGRSEDLGILLGRRGAVKRHLAGQIADEEFYRLIAERALERRVFARMKVAGRGTLLVELFPAEAPITVENFCRLAERQYFVGHSFHRVVPNFVIQGGDPRHDMEGGPGHAIPCEINSRPFLRGAMGMALSGKDTGGSQFFICHLPQPRLDGGYTVFGQLLSGAGGIPGAEVIGEVSDGFAILNEITQYDRIEEVAIFELAR